MYIEIAVRLETKPLHSTTKDHCHNSESHLKLLFSATCCTVWDGSRLRSLPTHLSCAFPTGVSLQNQACTAESFCVPSYMWCSLKNNNNNKKSTIKFCCSGIIYLIFKDLVQKVNMFTVLFSFQCASFFWAPFVFNKTASFSKINISYDCSWQRIYFQRPC